MKLEKTFQGLVLALFMFIGFSVVTLLISLIVELFTGFKFLQMSRNFFQGL